MKARASLPANTMNLDESQQQQIMTWIQQGLKVSDIQSKMAAELGLQLTYMEVRFLLDDLKLRPKDQERSPTPVLPVDPAVSSKAGPAAKGSPLRAAPEAERGGGLGGVQVKVDQVTRAGSVVSGKVTFRDGQSAEWYLDQFGRLGLAAEKAGYKPSQADLMDFQAELQNQLARAGF
jgi:hypothetical protein